MYQRDKAIQSQLIAYLSVVKSLRRHLRHLCRAEAGRQEQAYGTPRGLPVYLDSIEAEPFDIEAAPVLDVAYPGGVLQ